MRSRLFWIIPLFAASLLIAVAVWGVAALIYPYPPHDLHSEACRVLHNCMGIDPDPTGRGLLHSWLWMFGAPIGLGAAVVLGLWAATLVQVSRIRPLFRRAAIGRS